MDIVAIKLSENKFLTIVDRTLTEIFDGDARLNRLDTIRFCWMLKELGFDFIEINADILMELKKLPAGVNFLFRIEKSEDVRICIENNIGYCCIDEMLSFDLDMLSLLQDNGIDIMVEMRLDRMKDLKNLASLEFKSSLIKNIRIAGINGIQDVERVSVLINKVGRDLGIPLNICPENKFSDAAAILMEAVKKGLNSLTTIFAGDGREKAYASTDEVMAAARDLTGPGYEMNFNILSDALKCLKSITRINKPAAGKVRKAYVS